MSEPHSRGTEGASLWQAFREFLSLRAPTTLRESIEEVIDDYQALEEEPGDLDSAERAMLRNMLDLSEGKAGDIAVPRADISAIEEKTPFMEVMDRFVEAGHSRLPVYRDKLDEVIGMLHVKDVYAVLAERFHKGGGADTLPADSSSLIRKVLYVPPSMPLTTLLADMRRLRTHMAILVDEYGGTDGLVTIEDIVEEIVGEIEDEHDKEEEAQLIRLPDGKFEADARLHLEDLEEELRASFADPELGDEVDTLGGLCVMLAGHVPEEGECFRHLNGWELKILASNSRRVDRLLLVPPQEEASELEPF